jgi:hypothetical protein
MNQKIRTYVRKYTQGLFVVLFCIFSDFIYRIDLILYSLGLLEITFIVLFIHCNIIESNGFYACKALNKRLFSLESAVNLTLIY